jgi:uncharacterized protein YigA (DUF484 family)
MTQKVRGAKADPGGISAGRVAEFLRHNPDFFVKHPDALKTIQAPARALGDGVSDLQQAMIDRLRGEIEKMKGDQQELLSATRANMQTQSRIHACVLGLLGATSFEQLIQTVTTDFAVILDLDIVTLCIEAECTASLPVRTRGLMILAPGTIDAVLGPDRRLTLRGDIAGDPELFAGGAPLVRSDALVRLSISPATPPVLLAFGSRDPHRFDSGQATELIDFLGSVLEHVIRIWLHLPD